jgi:hypothetical protein
MRSVSEKRKLDLGRQFGAFVSDLEIPFPGNGDRRGQRPVRMAVLRATTDIAVKGISCPLMTDAVEKGFWEGSPSNIDSRPAWNA